MIEKYVLMLPDETVFAIKFVWEKREVTIGGKAKLYNLIEELIKDYFECNVPEIKFSQVNKCRYVLKNITNDRFLKAKRNLEKANFVVEKVNSLGTIMR